MREVEIPYEGATVRALELEFTTEGECWGEFTTEEGAHIKMRSIVSRIYRLIGKLHDDGTPIHILHGSVVIDTAVPSTAPESEATIQAGGSS